MIAKPVLKLIRKINTKLISSPPQLISFDYGATEDYVQYTGQIASDLIKEELLSKKPSLITRFGAVEMTCLLDSLNGPSFQHISDYLSLKTDSIGWRSSTIKSMRNNAGFFTPSKKYLKAYGDLLYRLLPNIDILGSWLQSEAYFDTELLQAVRVRLVDLEPYYHDSPWSAILQGKRVLVIHPFVETIRYQYENRREKLFENKDVLPAFELKTIKAVQSIAGNKPEGFKTWFDAFEYMKSEIDRCEFDYAIIGCGAYGMPLAGYIKEQGKKAIHLGGATQLLFGIRGKRWDECDFFREKFVNEYWIKPFKEDYPAGYEKVEGGCYW